jgi:transcriptional regulator with XRE-family HTH domain
MEGLKKMEEFKITGKTIRIARLLKGVSIKEFAKYVGLSLNYCSMIERGEAGLTHRNHYRMIREIRKLGYTDQQLAAIMILTENINEVEDKN